jgi:glycosyltransferase involved in cell wall biosynthesis
MLIGLDAIPLTETLTGVGRYTLELSRALAAASPSDEFELAYPSRYEPINVKGEDELARANLKLARVEVGTLGRRWWLVGLPRYARRRGYALFHGTNYEVPLRAPCPTVLTIHDLSVFTHAETHVARRARRLRLRLPVMARAATLIITPTEAVRGEACALLKLDPAKVIAIHEAPREFFRPVVRDEAAATLRRLGVEGHFLLAAGTIEPRKNLATLVRAFEQITRESAVSLALRLVIVGREGWLTRELRALVANSMACGRISFTGYVSDEDLRALYSSCLTFVSPSIYEGFGLPPLEAAACGAPLVASRIPAHLETLGAHAALFFAPADADELARALVEIARDETLRRKLSRAAIERAAHFKWEIVARQTLEVYARAVREWAGKSS